jgi:septin family protein
MRIEARNYGRTESDGSVGFSTIPAQLLRKAIQRGFSFNLLVVCEPGCGAKTLMNTLYGERVVGTEEEGEFSENTTVLRDGEVRLKLNITIYREKSLDKVSAYIHERNEMYNKNNVGILRERIEDPKIHACIFVLSPHSCREEDLLFMEGASKICTLIPVITKADSLLMDELSQYRTRVQERMRSRGIETGIEEEGKIPYAICGSEKTYMKGDKAVRGRMYPWGLVDAEDPSHFDLESLRDLLVKRGFVSLKRKSMRFYREWKEKCSREGEREMGEKEISLVKDIEGIMMRRLEEKKERLGREEFEVDKALKMLAKVIEAKKSGISVEALERELSFPGGSFPIK